MKKKAIALALAGCLFAGTLTACGTGVTQDSLIESLNGYEFERAHLTFSAETVSNVRMPDGTEQQNTRTVFGEAVTAGEDLDFMFGQGKTSPEYSYLFKRGDRIFTTGEREEPTFAGVAAAYTAEGSALSFDLMDVESAELPALPQNTDGLIKIAENIPKLFGSEFQKTETGYTLTYDLVKTAENLLGQTISVLEQVDEKTTVKQLFENAAVAEFLGTLLTGVSAADVRGLLPQTNGTLPPAEGKTAYEWLLALLDDRAFAQSAGASGTIGEIPLSDVFGQFSGEEKDALLETLRTVKEKMGLYLAAAFFGSDPGTLPEEAEGECGSKIVLEFDQAGEFTGISVNGEIGYREEPPYGTAITFEAKISFSDVGVLQDLSGARYKAGYEIAEGPVVKEIAYTGLYRNYIYDADGDETLNETRELTLNFTFACTYMGDHVQVDITCKEVPEWQKREILDLFFGDGEFDFFRFSPDPVTTVRGGFLYEGKEYFFYDYAGNYDRYIYVYLIPVANEDPNDIVMAKTVYGTI